MIRILVCAALVLGSVQEAVAQAGTYSIGQVNVGLGSTHLFQSDWSPYQDQFTLDISYIWNTVDKDLLMDVGFSFSFDKYQCSTCSAPITSEKLDAKIYSFRFGVGKWWRREKVSAAITGGLFAGWSEFNKYTTTSGSIFNQVESSMRGHAGLYTRSSVDFRLNDRGLRIGPFAECRLSSGSTDKNLTLNISSFALGLYLGWRLEDGNR